ncbi:MAG: HAD family hydrolase [Deltaproteobacteria bacterium]|nr:HAD family hydrolase [Deltaproteobacteria bacterium]
MDGSSGQGGGCPVCGKRVDPLRAGAVGIFDGTFVYFCSDACRATFGAARASTSPGTSPSGSWSSVAASAEVSGEKAPVAGTPPSVAPSTGSRPAVSLSPGSRSVVGPSYGPSVGVFRSTGSRVPVRPSAGLHVPDASSPSVVGDGVSSLPPPVVTSVSTIPPQAAGMRRPAFGGASAGSAGEGSAGDEPAPEGGADGAVGALEEDGEVESRKLELPAYGLATEPGPHRVGITPAALFGFLLLLGAFAAAHLARRWFTWVELPGWLPDAVAATGAGALLVLGLLDLLLGRGRGVDHVIVGTACTALVVASFVDGWATGTPQALAVLAVYSAAVVAERRLLAQRPAPLAAVQGGPRADALVDWGGARGPLLRGLRLTLRVFPLLPLAAAVAGVAWASLSGWLASSELLVPILVGSALAFVPWSVRHAGLVLGDLARAASAANVRYLDPAAVERAARTHHLVFLYRGVVTYGRPEVVEFVNYSDQPDAVILDLVASAEQAAGGSSLSEALLAFTQGRGAVGEATTRLSRFWPGHGVKATSARGEVWIGGRRMLLEEGVSTAPVEEDARDFEQAGYTVLFVALKRRVHAIVALGDPVRAEMGEAADLAHRQGMETHLLTGESRATTEHVARSARVRHIRPELTREERAAEIRGLREMGVSVTVVGRPAEPAQVIQDADVASAIGVSDPHGFPCDVAAAADDPRVAVACLSAARRASAAVWLQVVVAAGAALLNAGLAALGFLPPAATMALAAAVSLVPLLRRRRFDFAGSSGAR